jgi:hypothetical protein
MPLDRTPLGDEMAETMPTRKFPQPRRGQKHGRDEAVANDAAEIERRPALPDHPRTMDADVEESDESGTEDGGPNSSRGST